MTAEDFATVVEAARELNLSPRAVLHRITTGAITATKVGSGRTNPYVITRAELDRVKTTERAGPAAASA